MDSHRSKIPRQLFHVILTTSHLKKNPNNLVESVRVPGTYTSLPAAKAAAHSCLFDAGYERDWFDVYETNTDVFEYSSLHERTGLAVLAVANDGTTFRVRINTTPNTRGLSSDLPDNRVTTPLYYVIQADAEYDADEGSAIRDVIIEKIFESYEEAEAFARTALLSEEDGITKEDFAEYHEAVANEKDCGYGENVLVHAVSDYGVNYLISVIKNQVLEATHLAEASMRISF
ncbi:hypothetical protein ASPWEDRAFT_41184 [Aspergillus wentii DTO 134E9]|uniref:Uncharacterized protein n=1 Tax=Aspergillus wentii DTO 134E9 TaxID=1073089 RepID=A0A1L9RLX9_ASPWE|nr:uncharacterized protein ASPWEDRAFT_41184 [Aspergillus wentii DTO 134E9]OJJ35960.1 hypothetical protein ASPWEDRAFT_41184 [Aspergillus wentii DTO 134E9]